MEREISIKKEEHNFVEPDDVRQTAEALEKRNGELRLLSGTASDLLELDTKDAIYDYPGETLRQLSGADYLMLSEYNEKTKSVSIRQVLGLQSTVDIIAKAIGFDLMHFQIPVSDLVLQVDLSIRKQIYRIEGGLYALTVQKIPKAICKGLEKLLRGQRKNNCFSEPLLINPRMQLKFSTRLPVVSLILMRGHARIWDIVMMNFWPSVFSTSTHWSLRKFIKELWTASGNQGLSFGKGCTGEKMEPHSRLR